MPAPPSRARLRIAFGYRGVTKEVFASLGVCRHTFETPKNEQGDSPARVRLAQNQNTWPPRLIHLQHLACTVPNSI